MFKLDPAKQNEVSRTAHSILGVHEEPTGSNGGPRVHMIQEATGAFNAPWCVSTVQWIWKKTFGHTIADDTANAYYLADYAGKIGWVVPRPVIGGPVVYHVGAGHAGTVVDVYGDGTFDAIEGNEADRVMLVHRDPRTIRCTFICPPDLYMRAEPHKIVHIGPAPEEVSEHGRGEN